LQWSFLILNEFINKYINFNVFIFCVFFQHFHVENLKFCHGNLDASLRLRTLDISSPPYTLSSLPNNTKTSRSNFYLDIGTYENSQQENICWIIKRGREDPYLKNRCSYYCTVVRKISSIRKYYGLQLMYLKFQKSLFENNMLK